MAADNRNLHALVADRGRLAKAWEHILQRADEEELSGSMQRFAAAADANLDELARQLAERAYVPAPLTRVVLPKPDGGERLLSVPTVRDRVVERSLLDTVDHLVDPLLGISAFAYREGIGRLDAVQAVARLRDEGLRWVLRADVNDCFDSVPRNLALRWFLAALPDRSVDNLVERLVSRRVHTDRGLRDTVGLPQGTSLSPIMTNLVLTALDDALRDAGMAIIRYADDFVVACDSADQAWEAARTASAALEEIGMELGPDKTEVMSFEEGFCFLGEDFGPRYPPVVEDRVPDQDKKVLYVGRQGCRVFVAQGRVLVESKDDEELASVPKTQVSRIVCFGSIGMSAGLRSWALASDVDVVFVSRNGTYQGQHLSAADGTRVDRLRRQIAAADDLPRSMTAGREIIAAKIRHQITVLRNFTTTEHADKLRDAVRVMQNMARMIPDAGTQDELMGLEGAAAAAYFPVLGQLVPQELRFELRSRQPPLDVLNSALGYGYAILLGETVSALVAAGLDPNIGLLHRPVVHRTSLALDLIEEFRPMIVDQVVIAAARRRRLTPDHGQRIAGASGIHLTKAGKEALIGAYEQRMLQPTAGAIGDFRGSMRRHLYRQAQLLARFIDDPEERYAGMSWR